MLRYPLDNLSWFDFEGLVQTVLKSQFGFEIEAWGGSGDWGRDAYFEGTLAYPSNKEVTGTFLFQCKFVSSANAAGAKPENSIVGAVKQECDRIEKREVKSRTTQQAIPAPDHYALFTNAPLGTGTRKKIGELLVKVFPACKVHIHDGQDLCAWLDLTPQILRAFPQLLSLRDSEILFRKWINADVLSRSTAALTEAQELKSVFVPTQAFNRTLELLDKFHFVVLEGPPEMGKTAIGRMVALSQASLGWESLECVTPEEVERVFDSERKQVFLVDDFFGRTEYDPSRVKLWQSKLPLILGRLNSEHWLVFTTRAHLLKMAKAEMDIAGSHGRAFPEIGELTIVASDLTYREKALILYKQAKTHLDNDTQKQIIREHAADIVRNPHFTPERIRRLVAEMLPSKLNLEGKIERSTISNAIKESLANPTKGMRVTFGKLPESHQWLLFALLEGEEDVSRLQMRFECLVPDDLSDDFDTIIQDLTDGFIRHSMSNKLSWIHPSCRDLTIDQLGKSKRLKPGYRPEMCTNS